MSNEEGSIGGITAAKIAESRIEDLKIQEERLKKEKEIAAASLDHLTVMQKQLEIDRFRNSQLIGALESLKSQEGVFEQLLADGEALEKTVGKLAEGFNLSLQQQQELKDAILQGKDALEEVIQKQREYRAQQDITKQFSQDIERSVSNMAQKMGIASKFSKTTAGGIFEMGKAFVTGNIPENMDALVGGLTKMLNPINIAASLLDIMINKVLELNKAAIELNIATGYANDFQTEMTNLTAETIKFGVSMKDSNAALSSVVKTVSGINLRSKQFRDELSKSAALMTKLGVTTETTAKNQQFLDKTFRMGGPEISSTLEDIAMSAEAIGISAQEMSSNFVAAMGYLTSFGKEGIRMFKEIQLEASKTGLAVDKLLGITKTFDEFSSGAKKAAELNAVLGTSLSSIALMTMDPEQRLKALKEQLQNATGGVDSMTHAQKLYLSNSLGMNIAEMTALLGEETEEMARAREAKEAQAEIEERLADAATKLLPFMDRMSMAFEKLASNKKLMNNLAFAIESVVNAIVFMIENIEGLLFVGAGLMLWTSKMSLRSLYLGFSYGRATGQLSLHALATKAAAVGTKLLSFVTGILTFNMSSLAFVTNLTMGKLMLLVGVLYLIIRAATKPNSPPLYLIFGVIAVSVFFLGRALDAMGPKAILAAFVLALLAGAVSLIFYGISAVIESITSLVTVLLGSLDVLPMLALNMYLLGSAFLFLGYSAMVGSLGIFMGIGALTIMLALFKLTGTSMKDMFGAGDEIMKIGTGILNLGNGLTALKSAISEIKNSIGSEGLFAASIEGNSSSIVMGEGVHVAKLFKNNKVTVDVKMPEIAMPKINVKVYIGEKELEQIITPIVESRQGQAQ